MNVLDFKGRAAAKAWENDLADLNERTNEVLVEVHDCINEIKTESSGDFVEELVTTAADLADATAEMIKALDSLKDVLNSVMSKIAEVIGEVVQNIVTKRDASTDF